MRVPFQTTDHWGGPLVFVRIRDIGSWRYTSCPLHHRHASRLSCRCRYAWLAVLPIHLCQLPTEGIHNYSSYLNVTRLCLPDPDLQSSALTRVSQDCASLNVNEMFRICLSHGFPGQLVLGCQFAHVHCVVRMNSDVYNAPYMIHKMYKAYIKVIMPQKCQRQDSWENGIVIL